MTRDSRSEEISSQSSGSLINPTNIDERKEVEIAAGCSIREDQLQTHCDERKHSKSNSTWKPVILTSTSELRNMEYTNHQYMSKIFQFLHERLGNDDAVFSIRAYKTNVLI